MFLKFKLHMVSHGRWHPDDKGFFWQHLQRQLYEFQMYPRLNTDNHTKREMLKKKEKPVFDYSVRCFFINCNPGSTFTKDYEKCIAKCEKKFE